MKTKYLIPVIPVLALFSGCDPDSPVNLIVSPPETAITQVVTVDKVPGDFARIIVTVSNTGDDATAYSVQCEIALKDGNTIIDWGAAFLGTLGPGESARNDAVFGNIQTHRDYTSAEYHLYWYDAQGNYYE